MVNRYVYFSFLHFFVLKLYLKLIYGRVVVYYHKSDIMFMHRNTSQVLEYKKINFLHTDQNSMI